MNAARLNRSARLQRVHGLLADGREYSTRDIDRDADVCAVSACIAELRANGAAIDCRQIHALPGERIFLYRMRRPANDQAMQVRR